MRRQESKKTAKVERQAADAPRERVPVKVAKKAVVEPVKKSAPAVAERAEVKVKGEAGKQAKAAPEKKPSSEAVAVSTERAKSAPAPPKKEAKTAPAKPAAQAPQKSSAPAKETAASRPGNKAPAPEVGGREASPEPTDEQYQAAIERVRRRVVEQGGASSAPPGVGGEGPGEGGIVRGLAFLVYYNELQSLIKEKWVVAERKPGLSAVLRFGVHADGEVFDVELVRSSGDSVFDESALRAVSRANPLPPPPAGYRREFAVQKVEVIFGGSGPAD